jgi:signal transduction histidine kinase
VLARTLWLAIAVIALVQVIFGAPAEYASYLKPCTSECGGSLLTPASVRQLEGLGLSINAWALYAVGLELFFVGAWSTVACLIFWRKGDEPVAWFISLTLLTFGHAFPGFTQVLWYFDHNLLWLVLAAPIILFAVCGIVIFFYVFPDGRFVPSWTRWLSVLWVLWSVFALLTTTFEGSELYYNTYYLALALGLASQIYRYRRVASLLQKQQTKWVVYGFAVAIAMFLGVNVAGMLSARIWDGDLAVAFVSQTLIYVCMSLIPISIDMAIFRARLWDIDVIIGRTLLYGALTASVIAIYVLLVGYLGTLFQSQGNFVISLAATGLVAVLFQPLRQRLQRGVNRLLYGERDDPYAVISRLGQRLEATLVPSAVLPAIVETVAGALKLPYAAIALKQGDEMLIAAEYPAHQTRRHGDTEAQGAGDPRPVPREALITLPLTYQGEAVGRLLLAPRAAGEAFAPADRRLLDDLARQAGVAAHAVLLTADLQRSRERLVTTREEERRRLRRDLHDGLGPQLAGLTLKLDAARNLVASQPQQAALLIDELKSQTQGAIADIRRLVYELRPPALDELGLVGALRQQVAQYQYDRLRVDLDAPERLPPLPAAVEVAAYRIALEALTNIIRHAQAGHCAISLSVSNGLCLDIRDDGRGLPDGYRAGVGLHSMRERADELGGSCQIASVPGGGTSVMVWLPLEGAG